MKNVKDLSGQHLLSVMAVVVHFKCSARLPSLYSVWCIWFEVKNVFVQIYRTGGSVFFFFF